MMENNNVLTSVVTLISTCPLCQRKGTITVKEDGLRDFENGVEAQHAFPDLKPDHREIIISGICSFCWEKYGFKLSLKGNENDRANREQRKLSIRYHRLQTPELQVSTSVYGV